MHLDAEALFRAHASFVASFLFRLGVDRAALDDAVQEVFLVAHRRGGFEEGAARPTTWLAEIALRVASAARGRARKNERASGPDLVAEIAAEQPTPFEALSSAESFALVERALAGLSLEHRAVFVLYEIEEERCEDIAEALGVPIGTVHSRLHHARREFHRAFERIERAAPPPKAARSGGQR